METYNTAPYFDDFDEFKNFHQIMFKPGTAVQARELTQLQTILRDQIEKFGNHVFKHGSIVIPGNSISDLSVPYVKVESQYNGVNINTSYFQEKTLVGITSGVEAVVKRVEPATASDPVVFYLSYSSGNVTTGRITFQDGEELYVKDAVGVRVTVTSSQATGIGSLAYINRGVYYVNGTFASVDRQSTVLSKFGTTPSCHVLLKIDETIVSSVDDESLLDNAQGSYNYAAPGADRVKITLTLTTLPLGSTIGADYIEIMRLNNGVLEEHAKNSKYSELEKSLARRTFDESGNYVVEGFEPSIREHLKNGNNGGVYVDGDTNKLVVDVSRGKAYINGFEVEKIVNTKIAIDKARSAAHIKDTSVNLRPVFGQYLIISDVVGGATGFKKGEVDLYGVSDPSNSTAAKIGTAKVVGIDYLDAGESQPNMYKLIVSNVSMIGTNRIENIGGIRAAGNKSAIVLNEYVISARSGTFEAGEIITHSSGRTATVKFYNATTSRMYAYKHSLALDMPIVGDEVVGGTSNTTSVVNTRRTIINNGTSGLLFTLPKSIPATLKNPDTNAYDLKYTVQVQLSMSVISGEGSVSISSGSFDAIEEGTFVAIGPSGVIDNSFFSISGNSIVTTDCPQNGIVIIYANVTKENVFPKSKTLKTHTETIVSPGTVITLSKADIVSLTSVVDSVGNITPNYTMYNGQTDYEYGLGQLTLKSGRPSPAGDITVTYTYYDHTGVGDFFCVDSYSSIAQFLETPAYYQSRSGDQVYDLANCIDFRPLANATTYETLVENTVFATTLQYYVPRIDSLVIDSSGKLEVISGLPSERPSSPTIPAGQFELNRFYIPEYTRRITSVVSTRMDVERFTMNDIKQIVNRVGRVEEFATLTAAEMSITNFSVVDAQTGLDRFKTGYLVEFFDEPFTLASTLDQDYAATVVSGTLQAPHEPLVCKLNLMETSENYVIKNGYMMLPYTEEVFAAQTLSSRVTNVNPFLIISWNGTLDIQPPLDSWIEMVDLPTIYNTVTEEVVVNVFVDAPSPPAYRITPDFNIIDEGQTVTFTVNTEQVANGTTLYWTITGAVGVSDFTDGALSGSVVINNNTGTFSKIIAQDALAEGSETFRVQLRTDSTSGSIVADSVEITIRDLNNNPPTYIAQPPIVVNNPARPVIPGVAIPTSIPNRSTLGVSSNIAIAVEGDQIIFNIATTNVPNGTVLYWETDGSTVAADFTDNVTTGSVTVNNSVAPIIRTVVADAVSDTQETVRVKVYTDVARTNLVAISEYVTVLDPTTGPTYQITANRFQVSEGESVTFQVRTNHVLNGTTLYWRIESVTGTVNANDFADRTLTGSVVINNSYAEFNKTTQPDGALEGTEEFKVNLYTDAARTNLVASTDDIEIVDTANISVEEPIYIDCFVDGLINIDGRFSNKTSPDQVLEGGTITLYILSNLPVGTQMTWEIRSSTVTTADFVGLSSLTGTVLLGPNSRYGLDRGTPVNFTIASDLLLEGKESFQFWVTQTVALPGTFTGAANRYGVEIVDSSQQQFSTIEDLFSYVKTVPSLHPIELNFDARIAELKAANIPIDLSAPLEPYTLLYRPVQSIKDYIEWVSTWKDIKGGTLGEPIISDGIKYTYTYK